MAEKKDTVYNKGVVPRTEEFQDSLELKGEVYEFIKETLESTTEEAFKGAGFDRSESPAGEYADGKFYGAGTAEDKFNVKVGGQTQTLLNKEIIFGGKKMTIEIHLVIRPKSKTMEIKYKNTEDSAFRGYHDDGGPIMVNDQIAIDLNDLKEAKKRIKDAFEKFAKKEVIYLTKTKLGVEDKIEKSTASVVEGSKKISFNDIFFLSEQQFLDRLGETNETPADPDNLQTNDLLLSDKLENTKPRIMPSAKGGFDSYHIGMLGLGNNYTLEHLMREIVVSGKVDGLIQAVGKSTGEEIELEYDTLYGAGSEVFDAQELYQMLVSAEKRYGVQNEITTAGAGPGAIGNIRYDAPLSGTPIKRKMKKDNKFENTEYAKRMNLQSSKGNWAPTIQETKDGFWQVVPQDVLNAYKKDHIMGAPGAEGIEINSDKESEFNSGGVKRFPGGKSFKNKRKEKLDEIRSINEAHFGQSQLDEIESLAQSMIIDDSIITKYRTNKEDTLTSLMEKYKIQKDVAEMYADSAAAIAIDKKYALLEESTMPIGLQETGEWVNDSEQLAWLETLRSEVKNIINNVDVPMSIVDVRGFDNYQGPYAIVKGPDGKSFKIWTIEGDKLWVDNFPIDNTSSQGKLPGFEGFPDEIAGAFEAHYAGKQQELGGGLGEVPLNEGEERFQKRWKKGASVGQKQLNERWKRLSTIGMNETIKKAESVVDDILVRILPKPEVIKEEVTKSEELTRNHNIDSGDSINEKKLVTIKKNKSLSGVEYLVKEEDSLNESKAFIFDFKTGNLVNNPNYKVPVIK